MSAKASNVVAFPAHRMNDREPWMTRREMADHLGVCLKTVDNLVTAGMPSLKLGKSRRFKLSEVEPWLRQRGSAA